MAAGFKGVRRMWPSPALLVAGAALLYSLAGAGLAAPAPVDPSDAAKAPSIGGSSKYPEGAKVYQEHCAGCHDTGAGRAPARVILSNMTPRTIYDALTTGAMRVQGSALSDPEKQQVAQNLTGQALLAASDVPAPRMCDAAHAAFDRTALPAFKGWGLDDEGTHSVSSRQAGITKANVGQLKLKWAFGFPGANRARSEPALGGGAIFVGSHPGTVYALDRRTGCVRWTFEAGVEVRTGIVLAPWTSGDPKADPLVFFGDWHGNVFALKAFSGKLAWKVHADDHPAAVITATPALYDGTLYVGVSSLEEASAAANGYSCCTFRGSVLALDATTGAQKWHTWLVDEPKPQPGGTSLGPSGVPVWAGLAIDRARSRLIVATGDNYTRPATALSDAIVALDLDTGAIAWHWQAMAGDTWNVDCISPQPDQCPDDPGPDYDFGTGAAVAKGKDGNDYIVDGNKSGIGFALDAATGKLMWRRQVGRGSMIGGTHFGVAAVNGHLILPISDMAPAGTNTGVAARPGLYALDIVTGEPVWEAPAPDTCANRPLCLMGYSGTITVTPELLFAGGDDAHFRIFDVTDGKLLWDTDTMQPYQTVNGVPGKGGAISGGAGPIADDGQLIVSSGYGFVSKLPGNVLLVFGVD